MVSRVNISFSSPSGNAEIAPPVFLFFSLYRFPAADATGSSAPAEGSSHGLYSRMQSSAYAFIRYAEMWTTGGRLVRRNAKRAGFGNFAHPQGSYQQAVDAVDEFPGFRQHFPFGAAGKDEAPKNMQDMQRREAGILQAGNEYIQKARTVHSLLGLTGRLSTLYPVRQRQATGGVEPLFHSFHTPYY